MLALLPMHRATGTQTLPLDPMEARTQPTPTQRLMALQRRTAPHPDRPVRAGVDAAFPARSVIGDAHGSPASRSSSSCSRAGSEEPRALNPTIHLHRRASLGLACDPCVARRSNPPVYSLLAPSPRPRSVAILRQPDRDSGPSVPTISRQLSTGVNDMTA